MTQETSRLRSELARMTELNRINALAALSLNDRQALGLELSEDQKELLDLRQKYEREVIAHRENVKLMYHWNKKYMDALEKLDRMAHSFMQLHDLAKEVVGPKVG